MAEMDGPRVGVAEGAERWMELGWVRSGMRIGKDDVDEILNEALCTDLFTCRP